jgi:hypothetical protein
MRDPARIPRVMKKLGQLWKKHPDWRFNQLLINAGLIPDGGHWHVQDDVIEERIDVLLKEGF